jgi:putative pyruvate formate lyase activating enzyme
MAKSLYLYQKILNGDERAKYLLAKETPVHFQPKEGLKDLWNHHEKKIIDKSAKTSFLDLKIELADRIFSACEFCERKCKVNRHKATGECGVQEARVASQFMHWGEEPILVPSYTIFFSGCTFHCVFCQNWSISQVKTGYWLEPELLAQMIAERAVDGAKNVNWVGGEPTPNLPYILKVLKHTQTNLPQVWNSNLYCSEATMKLLGKVIDVYLTDFKYGHGQCAFRLSKVRNYWEIITRNHLLASEQGELLIRHLVMPNHLECCTKPVLSWIAENLPNSLVNLMFQYRPEYHAKDYKEIAQPISTKEYTKARDYAESLGLNLI